MKSAETGSKCQTQNTSGQDTLKGTVGADEIFGYEGDDVLDGKEGSNTIWGGEGDDTITTGKGRDLIYAGDDDDLIKVKANHSGTFIVGGYGDDIVSLEDAKSGTLLSLDYDFQYDASLDFIEVTIRSDSMSIDKTDSSGDTSRDSVNGLSNLGPDGLVLLFGTRGDDIVQVDRSSGPAIRFYADGDDTFDGDEDTYEEITFGSSFRYDAASDSTFAGFNEITITGNSSGQMSGKIEQTRSDEGAGSTDEYKTQFSGVDLIEGSSGDDFVKGSSGDDKFRPGYGNDGFDGGKGIDTVYYDSAGVERTMVNLSKKYAEAWYSDSGYDEASADFYRQDSFAFSNQAQYDGLKKVENVVGSHGDDTIRGDDKKNYFYGGAGNDVLNGKDGNDTLNGGDGDDKLRGLNGKDRFEFDFSDGADSVYAFEDGADKFIINGGLTFADVEITDLGKHALITFGETSVTVMGTDHALLGEADFIFA